MNCLLKKYQMEAIFFLILDQLLTDLIPVVMQERLLDIGAWLKVNGEAIYNTKVWKEMPSPNIPVEWVPYWTIRLDG